LCSCSTTLARRAIRQIGEQLAELGQLPDDWSCLEADTAALVRAAKQATQSEELSLLAKSLERRKTEAEQWLRDTAPQASEAVSLDPEGAENGPHIISTNLSKNLKETVIAAEEGSRAATAVSPSAPPALSSHRTPYPGLTVEREYRLKVEHLLDLAPRLLAYILTANPEWRDIIDAAGQGLRHELGVSVSLWAEACRVMGREQAALALAIVSTKPATHFTRGAGGYFAGMLRKYERGELRLERSLWALKDQKWGGIKRSRETGQSGYAGRYRGGH
jgi:replication initiation protein RepC